MIIISFYHNIFDLSRHLMPQLHICFRGTVQIRFMQRSKRNVLPTIVDDKEKENELPLERKAGMLFLKNFKIAYIEKSENKEFRIRNRINFL